MKDNEQFKELVDKIRSLPEPDYEEIFDRNKQDTMHENLMTFYRNFEKRKRNGAKIKRISTGLAGTVALILFAFLFFPVINDENTASNPVEQQFELYFAELTRLIDNFSELWRGLDFSLYFAIIIILINISYFVLKRIVIRKNSRKISATVAQQVQVHKMGNTIILILDLAAVFFIYVSFPDNPMTKWFWITLIVIIFGLNAVVEYKFYKENKKNIQKERITVQKKYSWRSYTFLILSILVPLFMILLDPIAVATAEQVGLLIMIFIIVATLASLVLAVLTFSYKNEKKNIAIIALLITVINIAIIIFFAWFGSNFA